MSRISHWIAPALLAMALLLGGSAQGMWNHLALQLAAAAALGLAMLSAPNGCSSGERRSLMLLLALALLWVLLQRVPLPPALWSSLPGRAVIADGYALLGVPLPALPIHIAPHRLLPSLLALAAPVALLMLLIRSEMLSRRTLSLILLGGALAGCLLGLLQVTGGSENFYLYRRSAFGSATGFFANSNHMGLLLLVALPFLVALAATEVAQKGRGRRTAALLLALAATAVLGLGILLNHSLAVLLLGLPVLVGSLLIARPTYRTRRFAFAALGAGILAALVVAFLMRNELGEGSNVSLADRLDFWRTGVAVLRDHWLVGTGLGAFPSVFHLFENPAGVDATFVNHAHNDYLELVAETGLPGLLLLLGFIGWWLLVAARAWRSEDRFARAAALGSAAILLHSLVDFPLRTPAIGAVLALCLALMLRRRPPEVASEPGDLWPTRHWTADRAENQASPS